MNDTPENPQMKVISEHIAPHLNQAAAVATQHGIALLCIVQCKGMTDKASELAAVGAQLTQFTHPLPKRFVAEFYATAKADDAERDLTVPERHLSDAFLSAAGLWLHGTPEQQQLALSAALVLGQGFATADEVLNVRMRSTLVGVLGFVDAQRFYVAMSDFKGAATGTNGDTFVVIGTAPAVVPGTN